MSALICTDSQVRIVIILQRKSRTYGVWLIFRDSGIHTKTFATRRALLMNVSKGYTRREEDNATITT